MEKVDTFENRLNIAFKENKINKKELAYESGIKLEDVNNCFKGTIMPNGQMLVGLSKTLGVDIRWLLGFDVPKNRYKETKRAIKLKLNKLGETELVILNNVLKIYLEYNY